MIAVLITLALAAGDIEAPGPRPAGDVVVVDELTLAMPAPLALWYERRHRYAGQLEARVAHLEGRVELAGERVGLADLRTQACEVDLAALRQERRWRGLRDVGLVALGAGSILAGAWAVKQVGPAAAP